jgi:putative phosphonate metabolism protein
MPERFAIYCAPAPDAALSQRAARWLGRDSLRGDTAPLAIAGIGATERAELTRSARRYGFHATLKAPMALKPGATREALEAALARFAAAHHTVPIGTLVLAALEGFIALIPAHQDAMLTAFAAACVADFEPFRAPISPAERARRLAAGLTARQVDHLDRYGYPFVMDDFLFHMTLTDRLPPEQAASVMAAAQTWFAPALETPVVLDRLVLFHETEAGAPFRRLADFPLALRVSR